jgi:hypothetical protein
MVVRIRDGGGKMKIENVAARLSQSLSQISFNRELIQMDTDK